MAASLCSAPFARLPISINNPGPTERYRPLMLTSIRTTFQKGIARLILIALMTMLILSFALWGIQDIFRGFRSNEAVSIGSTVISTEEFQRAYTQEVRRQSNLYKRP